MDSASSDPFFLDWGSSVNVDNDLRRAIQSETTAIDKEIRSLDNSIRTEDKTSSQHNRDFSHAQAELINLSRGAEDDKDNAAMNEQIQMRLSDSLAKEVIAVISQASSEETVSTHRSEDDMPSTYDAFELGMAEDVAKRARDVKNLKMSIQAKNENVDDWKSKLAEVTYQLDNAGSRIARDQKNQATWNDDVEVKRRESDAEKQRIRCTKESVYRARKNTGEYTTLTTNDVSRLIVHYLYFEFAWILI